MSKLLKIALAAIFVLILIFVGVWIYFAYYKLAYSDDKYGFALYYQRGWYSVPNQEGIYYTIGTSSSPNGKVISTFGLVPIPHAPNTVLVSSEFEKDCKENSVEKGGEVDFSEITINNLRGFVCSYQTVPKNVSAIYILRQYYLLNNDDKTYDYLITVSYPKGDYSEEQKVDRLLNSFHAK